MNIMTLIAATIAGFGSGYAMCNFAMRGLRADAWRWRAIDTLRNTGRASQAVTIWKDDGAGRAMIDLAGRAYRAASVDICLAQALNERA